MNNNEIFYSPHLPMENWNNWAIELWKKTIIAWIWTVLFWKIIESSLFTTLGWNLGLIWGVVTLWGLGFEVVKKSARSVWNTLKMS